MYTYFHCDEDGYNHCEMVTEYRKANGKLKYYSTIAPEKLFSLKKNALMTDIVSAWVNVSNQSARHIIIEAGGQEYDPILVEYDYDREYGGPEEGGWWFDVHSNPRTVTEEVKDDKTIRTFTEFCFGENETHGRPIYC